VIVAVAVAAPVIVAVHLNGNATVFVIEKVACTHSTLDP